MNVKRVLMSAIAVAALCVCGSNVSAQENNNGGQGRQGGGRNFDPAQRQQWMMDRTKERLEITDETEWKAVQPLVQKVMDARMATWGGRGMGVRRGPGGGDNAQGAQAGRSANPEAEALQKALDSKASAPELKAAIAKVREARKEQQAKLEQAQEDLRKVLTARQEAQAVLAGLLD